MVVFKLLKPLFFYKIVVQVIIYACLTFVISIGFCLYTESGTKAALEIINSYSTYKLKYQTISGTLGTTLTFKDFRFESEKYQIKAQDLTVSWEWLDLLKGTLHITELAAQEMDIIVVQLENTFTLQEAIQSIEHPSDLELFISGLFPYPINVSKVELLNSRITTDTFTHEIKILKLDAFQPNDKLLKSFIYRGTLGNIEASQDQEIKLSWDLSIPTDWTIPYLAHEGFQTRGQLLLDLSDITSQQNTLEVNIKAPKLTLNEQHFENINLNIEGTLQSHTLKLSGCQQYPFELHLSGKGAAHQWVGHIEQLTVEHPKFKYHSKAQGKVKIDYQSPLHILIDLNTSDQRFLSDLYIQPQIPFALNGNIQTRFNNLKAIEPFLPIPAQATGHLEVNLNLTGTILQPDWHGTAILQKMHFSTPQYGTRTTLDKITFTKQKDKTPIVIDGVGRINNKSFTLKGSAILNDYHPEVIVNIQGKDLIVSQTPEYYIIASPELTFSLKDNKPSLTGHILIPEANINQFKGSKKTSLSHDVVIINEPPNKPQESESSLHPLNTDIEIILGSNIKYKGTQLTSEFTGKLRLTQKPYKVPRLHGEINLVKGKYRFQSKTFTLTYGKLIYAGSTINNPLLDIEAKQTAAPFTTKKTALNTQPLELGIKLTGQFSDPKISFFSTPTLPEADIMSYLILGRPQSEATHAQEAIILQALSQLSTLFGHGDDISFNLAERLHLDHIGFVKGKNNGHSSFEDTILTLGKQISSRLYLNYSLGLYDSTNNIALQYKLNKNLSVEAQAGTASSSADLIFSLDS